MIFTPVCFEYVSLSNRFVPELINTLHGLIFVSSTGHKTRPLPPCKGGNYLVVTSKIENDLCKTVEKVILLITSLKAYN